MTNEEKQSAVEGIKESSNSASRRDCRRTAGRDGSFQRRQRAVVEASRHVPAGQSGRACGGSRGGRSRASITVFLLRTRVPGGKLTSAQLLAELALSDEFGNGTLRITSRQGLQLHGVLKTDLARGDSARSMRFISPRWGPAAT